MKIALGAGRGNLTCQAKTKRYTYSTREVVLQHLLSNANDSFLWVSLVCEELGKYNVLPHHTSKVLQSFPAGLDKLYQRMLDELLHSRDDQICKVILAVVTAAFEPLSLAELAASDERLACFQSDLETLSAIVTCCGSFLSIRNDIVYTVHQSARDYLVTSSDVFPSSIAAQHYLIFSSTMHRMQETLHRNMYNVHDETMYIPEISKPQSSPLDTTRYGCIYWVDHLHKSTSHAIESPSTVPIVETFLKIGYLYWLEAMSLLGCVSTAIRAIRKLGPALPETASPELKDLVEDTLRFALTHREICDTVPLQLYHSALIFSPEQSRVRQHFISEVSPNTSLFPSSFQQWDAHLFSIPKVADRDRDFEVSRLKASPDGQKLAMIRDSDTILILDSFTGETITKVRSRQHPTSLVGFDAEGKHLVTWCDFYSSVDIWNSYTGGLIRTFWTSATFVVLSQDKRSLASANYSGVVRFYDPWDGSKKYTVDLRHGEGRVEWIDIGLTKSSAPCLFSIVSTNAMYRPEIVVQSPQTGQLIARTSLASPWQKSYATLSPDCKRLLIVQNKKLQLWDGDKITNLRCVWRPTVFNSYSPIAWAPDGRSFAVATNDAVILYEPERQTQIGRITLSCSEDTRLCYLNGTTLASLDSGSLNMLRITLNEATANVDQVSTPIHHLSPGPNGRVELSNWLGDNEILIAASDNTLRRIHIPDSSRRSTGVFSPNHHYALVDNNGLINIWDTNLCLCLHKLRGHADDKESSKIVVEFDPLGQLISANHEDGKIRTWDPTSGDCLRTFDSQHWSSGLEMAASADGGIAIVPQDEKTLYTWGLGCVRGRKTEWTLETSPLCLSFNSHGRLAVLWRLGSEESCLSIVDVSIGTCLRTFRLSWAVPYARFYTGSISRIDIGRGVLQLGLERLTEVEKGLQKKKFQVYNRNQLGPVWNRYFLKLFFTDTEAWLMRGPKKVLWVPRSVVSSIRVTPDFETGASNVAMIYNSHPLILRVEGK